MKFKLNAKIVTFKYIIIDKKFEHNNVILLCTWHYTRKIYFLDCSTFSNHSIAVRYLHHRFKKVDNVLCICTFYPSRTIWFCVYADNEIADDGQYYYVDQWRLYYICGELYTPFSFSCAFGWVPTVLYY